MRVYERMDTYARIAWDFSDTLGDDSSPISLRGSRAGASSMSELASAVIQRRIATM